MTTEHRDPRSAASNVPMGNIRALSPRRFVCVACGKTSATKYGLDGDKSRGWDSSCAINSVLCELVDGKWTALAEPFEGRDYEMLP